MSDKLVNSLNKAITKAGGAVNNDIIERAIKSLGWHVRPPHLWQPFDTAPKKGPPILAALKWVLGDGKDPLQVEIVEWDEEQENWYCANGGLFDPDVTLATHWMPVPEAPK